MICEEMRIESEIIYEGAILNLRRDKVTATGGEAYREIVEHNGAVGMVALTDEGHIVLVRQYRYACGRTVLEIPAGKIDKGEMDPEAAAIRELKEETGYEAKEIIHLGDCNPSCAYSEEVIHLYLMSSLSAGAQSLDEDEAIEVVELPFEQVYSMAARGQLVDAKTLAALMMAKEHLKEE